MKYALGRADIERAPVRVQTLQASPTLYIFYCYEAAHTVVFNAGALARTMHCYHAGPQPLQAHTLVHSCWPVV